MSNNKDDYMTLNKVPTDAPDYVPNDQTTSDTQQNETSHGKDASEQSTWSCIFNFVNTTLGSGVLTIPFDIAVAGYVLGIVISLIFASVSTISYFMLMKTADYSNKFQYQDVSNKIFPKIVGIIATIASMFFSVGCVISYVIVIKDNLFFFKDDQVLYKNLTLAGIMFVLILPLCFLPNLENLKFNSYLIIVVIIYIALVCVYTYFFEIEEYPTYKAANWSGSLIQAFPLTTQAYNSQYNFLNLYRELHNRKENGKKVVFGNISLVLMIYMTIGIFGYLSFGDKTKSNILVNLKETGGVLAQIANVGMIVLMVCHYPIPVYSLRKALETMIFKNEYYSNKKVSFLISTVVVVAATFIGMFLKSIDNILDFTGSLAGGTLGMIIPGFFAWKMGKINGDKKFQIGGIIVAFIGFAITIIGFGMACYKWIILPFIKN